MTDGSENGNRQLAFELQNSHVCEKRSNIVLVLFLGKKMLDHIINQRTVTKNMS